MPRTSRRGRRPAGITIDFTDVEAGGISVEDGVYAAEVTGCEKEESESGNDYLAWKYKLEDNGAVIYDNTSLLPQALWRLKGLLITLGLEIPDGEYKFVAGDVIGEKLRLEITNEEWEGKDRPQVTEFLPYEEDEPEEKPKRGRGRPRKDAKKGEEKPTRGRRGRRKKSGPQVGDTATFEDEGEEITGEITSLSQNGKEAVITTDDGEEWEVAVDELTVE